MNKCCDKIKGRLLTLALIVSMLLGQTVPVAVSAEDTSTETVNPILLERARSRMQKDALRNYKNDDSTIYTADGLEIYSPTRREWFKTTKYWAEQHPDLKEDMDEYLGVDNLILTKVKGWSYVTTLENALNHGRVVYRAFADKEHNKKMAKIAVKHGIVEKKTDAVAPYIAFFQYYGIINRNDGLLDYDNSAKAFLTREQAALLVTRFMYTDYYILQKVDSDDYKSAIDACKYVMLLAHGEKGVTKKELSSSMTRLEFIWLLSNSVLGGDLSIAKIDGGSSTDITKAFKDINKKDLVKENWLTLDKDEVKSDNKAIRKAIKDGKISTDMIERLQLVYDMGVLKPDSKGNANLFKNISFRDAVKMIVDAKLDSLSFIDEYTEE